MAVVYCPVCNKKVYVRKGKVIPHGSNEDLCYGSYMSSKDCRTVRHEFFVIRLINFFHKLFTS